jgi:hypothetical protein
MPVALLQVDVLRGVTLKLPATDSTEASLCVAGTKYSLGDSTAMELRRRAASMSSALLRRAFFLWMTCRGWWCEGGRG